MHLRSKSTLGLLALASVIWGAASIVIQFSYSSPENRNLPFAEKLQALKAVGLSHPYWQALVLFGVICALVAYQFRRKGFSPAQFWGKEGLVESLPENRKSSSWFWIGFCVYICGLVTAESQESHYFLRDDNYTQFYPTILYACRTFWSGHWVSWNPYQLMGSPLTDLGIYSMTYPLTHVSYLAAKHLLRDESRFMDLFCWAHLSFAYVGTYFLGRKLRLSAPMATAVSVCYALSGFSLIGSRCWYYMSPTIAAIPLITSLALSFPFPDKQSWKWTVNVGVILGLLFHAGNAQMWAYTVCCFLLLLAARVLQKNSPLKAFFQAGPAMAIAVGIALPLLSPQLSATSGLSRVTLGEGILQGLTSTVYLYPFANSPFPGQSTQDGSPSGQFYYAGSIFMIVWLAAVAALVVNNGARKVLRQNPILAASLVAFLLACGYQGGIWNLMALLPVFNKFSHPIKFLPFFNLFFSLTGALLLSRALFGHTERRKMEAGLLGVLSCLMLYNSFQAHTAFYPLADAPSYQLPERFTSILKSDGYVHRIFPAGTIGTGSKGYMQGLRLNFPSAVGIVSIEGHDSLWKPRSPVTRIFEDMVAEPLETLRRYGVDFVILHRTARKEDRTFGLRLEELGEVPEVVAVEKALRGKEPLYRDNHVELYRVEGSESLAHEAGELAQPLAVSLDGNDVRVETASLAQGGKVMVNFLWRPGIEAHTGDRELIVGSDPAGRILVTLPAGIDYFHVGYHIQWKLPLLAGVLIFFVGIFWQVKPQLAADRSVEPGRLEFGD